MFGVPPSGGSKSIPPEGGTTNLQPLKYSRGAHAAANAHCHHAVAAVASFQLSQYRCRQLRSRAAQRMSKRNRATVHIHLVWVQLKHLDHCQRLRRESFIQLDHIDLIEIKSGKLQRLRNREHWTD